MNVGIVFTLIFAIIVVTLLLIFGYGSIINLAGFGQRANVLDSIEKIDSEAQKVYSYSRGSTRELLLSVSADSKICFINPQDPQKRTWKENWKSWDPPAGVINTINRQGSEFFGSNLWLITPDSQIGKGQVILKGSLIPKPESSGDSGNFCISGSRKIFFENAGQIVYVSE